MVWLVSALHSLRFLHILTYLFICSLQSMNSPCGHLNTSIVTNGPHFKTDHHHNMHYHSCFKHTHIRAVCTLPLHKLISFSSSLLPPNSMLHARALASQLILP